MLYHSIAPGTAVNLRRKRGEHHETGIRQTVTCNHLYACKGLQKLSTGQPPPRCGEYVAGLDALDGEPELPVRKLHRAQGRRLPLVELPGFKLRSCGFFTGNWSSWQHKRAGRCKSCKNLNFLLHSGPIRAIILRQSFPRPLAGVADIEGCDGHIHLNMAPISQNQK